MLYLELYCCVIKLTKESKLCAQQVCCVWINNLMYTPFGVTFLHTLILYLCLRVPSLNRLLSSQSPRCRFLSDIVVCIPLIHVVLGVLLRLLSVGVHLCWGSHFSQSLNMAIPCYHVFIIDHCRKMFNAGFTYQISSK